VALGFGKGELLTDVLTMIINGHPNSEIDQLLPWATKVKPSKPWPENDAYYPC
jgi:hypothetical protein